MLAGVWAEVLELDRVGVYDSFFELGGSSLLVTRALSRLGDAFQSEALLRAFFEAPRIAELAPLIEKARAGEQARAARIAPIPRQKVRRHRSSLGTLWN